MGLTKAEIRFVEGGNAPPETIEVLFNPTDLSIDRGANYAEVNIPGLQQPVLQYVRGTLEVLRVELFLDRSAQRESVSEDLEKLRALVAHISDLHAPPVVRFHWGDTDFQGVVTSLQERFQLFDEQGQIQRARATLEIKRWKAPEDQVTRQNPQSPDRTETWVVQQGDRLDRIASHAYGDPARWRHIADANDLARPRQLTPGTVLVLPSL